MVPRAKTESSRFAPTAGKSVRPDVLVWTQSGLTLIECKNNKEWRKHSSSFTAYVTALANQMGMPRSILWRHLGAVDFYLSLGSNFDGLPLPSLSAIEKKTSAENLELIGKISRGAPRSLIRQLLKLMIEGSLTRSELRRTWRIYQPVTGLVTQRGRRPAGIKGARPRIKPEVSTMLLAEVLYALSHISAWSGTSTPILYRIFTRPSVPQRRSNLRDLPVFIALILEDRKADIVSHGVDFIATVDTINARSLERRARFFDYFWIAIPFKREGARIAPAKCLHVLPAGIGLMQVTQDKIRVVRRPTRGFDVYRKLELAMLLHEFSVA